MREYVGRNERNLAVGWFPRFASGCGVSQRFPRCAADEGLGGGQRLLVESRTCWPDFKRIFVHVCVDQFYGQHDPKINRFTFFIRS